MIRVTVVETSAVLSASFTPPIVPDGDLGSNVASYARHLRAANLSPKTQRAYLEALAQLTRDRGMPTDVAIIPREHLAAFVEDQLTRLPPASAANRFFSLRPLFGWLGGRHFALIACGEPCGARRRAALGSSGWCRSHRR